MRSSLCEAPTRETRSGHNTGNYVPLVNWGAVQIENGYHLCNILLLRLGFLLRPLSIAEGWEQAKMKLKSYQLQLHCKFMYGKVYVLKPSFPGLSFIPSIIS